MAGHSSYSLGQSRQFATTRWSIVLAAKGRSASDDCTALAELCRAYWYPVYGLLRRRCRDQHQAQDLTQDFFAKLLEADFFRHIDPAKGRFRAFLLAAVKHFLSNEWDKSRAAKRGGGRRPLSLEFETLDWDSGESRFLTEPSHQLTAERHFERQWGLALLERVLSRLSDEYHAEGKLAQFDGLKPFLSWDREAIRYADVARKLEMSESALRTAAHRMRKRYRELLREEIGQTVASPEEIDDELRLLFEALDSSRTT